MHAVKECYHRTIDNSVPCLTELGLLYGPTLPRWVPNKRVDSIAMLSAFLAFKEIGDPDDHDYLSNFYMIEHKSKPIVSVQVGTMESAKTFVVNKVRPPNLPSRPCKVSGCIRCTIEQGGYMFRWYHSAWSNNYSKLARTGSWAPGEDECSAPVPNECLKPDEAMPSPSYLPALSRASNE